MSKPIPKHLREAFKAAMDPYNNDDLPDGAWFALLEEGARAFLKANKLRGDENDAAHQYLDMLSDDQAKKN